MALFPRQKTIIKGVVFKVPFMGWAQKGTGYISSGTDSGLDVRYVNHVQVHLWTRGHYH